MGITRLLLRVFGDPNWPSEKRFGYFDRAAQHVNTLPPQCENLTNPKPREHSDRYYCPARL